MSNEHDAVHHSRLLAAGQSYGAVLSSSSVTFGGSLVNLIVDPSGNTPKLLTLNKTDHQIVPNSEKWIFETYQNNLFRLLNISTQGYLNCSEIFSGKPSADSVTADGNNLSDDSLWQVVPNSPGYIKNIGRSNSSHQDFLLTYMEISQPLSGLWAGDLLISYGTRIPSGDPKYEWDLLRT